MVVCGGNTGKEIFSECDGLLGYSAGRKAARFDTISNISLRMAPSAATSCADLSSSTNNQTDRQKKRFIHMLLYSITRKKLTATR